MSSVILEMLAVDIAAGVLLFFPNVPIGPEPNHYYYIIIMY